MRSRASGSEDGVATVLALGSVAVLLAVTLVAVVVAQVVAARHVAAAAADLGALAGAGAVGAGPAPCVAAAETVAANAADLVDCRVDGLDVSVTAAVRSQPVLGLWWRPEVTARAGPAS